MTRIQAAWDALLGREPAAPPATTELERATTPPVVFTNAEHRVGLHPNISQTSIIQHLTGWAAIGVNAIADEVMDLKPQVFHRTMRESGAQQLTPLDNHPLKELLDRPSDNFTLRMLLRLMGTWLPHVGDVYLLKIVDGLGVTRQLEPLPPQTVELIPGRHGIAGYRYRSPHSGAEIEYRADEIIRIYKPDPENPFLALGNLAPVSLAFDASLFMDQTIRKHYETDATPKVALVPQEGANVPDEAQWKRFATEWKNALNRRLGSNTGIPRMTPPGFEIHEFGGLWGGKDLIPILDHYRDKVLASYGVPGSIVGLVQDVNRAAAETNLFVFESTTIKPLAQLIADALTIQLARDFDPNLVIGFEDFVTEDKAHKLEKRNSLLEHKVITVNEVREQEGLQPASWGDLPVSQSQEVPYTGEIPTTTPLPRETPEDDSSRDAEETEE